MNIPTATQADQTITLEQFDFDLIQMVAQQRGLSENDLETALQLILREWLEFQEEIPLG
jgi:hypothetical protein